MPEYILGQWLSETLGLDPEHLNLKIVKINNVAGFTAAAGQV